MFKKRNKPTSSINTGQINQAKEGTDSIDINQSKTTAKQMQDKNNETKQSKQEEGSQPRKRVKLDNQIGGSTTDRNNTTKTATHQMFQSLNYFNPKSKLEQQQANQKQEKILVGQEAEKTQMELAKQRYLQQVENTKLIKDGKISSKIYRGANNYANYKLSEAQLQNPTEGYSWKHGPTRAPSKGLQNTCRFDYDPSRCKDWHDCGYCVFGNSCIYLHDRSDYKTGWQQEKDYERSERERWRRINNPDLTEEPDYLKDLDKFKANQICSYCHKQFKNPVETTCRHLFCLKCATEMNNKQKKCIVCNKKLDGIMNSADKALKKQKQQYEEMLKMAAKSSQLAQGKRSKYRNINSLDVFTAQ